MARVKRRTKPEVKRRVIPDKTGESERGTEFYEQETDRQRRRVCWNFEEYWVNSKSPGIA